MYIYDCGSHIPVSLCCALAIYYNVFATGTLDIRTSIAQILVVVLSWATLFQKYSILVAMETVVRVPSAPRYQ